MILAIFFHLISIASKNGQVKPHQIKNLHTEKETINRMKMQPVEWEKISESHTSEKSLQIQSMLGTQMTQ